MPIYTYKCSTCGATFEAKQSISDPHIQTPCETVVPSASSNTLPLAPCGGKLFRTVGLTHFITKGAGFHNNDYGTSGPRRK